MIRVITLLTLLVLLSIISSNVLAQKSGGGKSADKKNDTTPPTLTVPADITQEAISSSGATVSFTVSATDNTRGSPTVSCNPATGSVFPLGQTTVSCQASDKNGNTSADSFLVSIIDSTPPTISLPDNITQNASSASGTVVTFAAVATDTVDSSVTANCSPTSETSFTLGQTTVLCDASDNQGNTASGSFTITIIDSAGPVVVVPSTITAEANNANGATVAFNVTATDNMDGIVGVTCTPLSDSAFTLGQTTVNCVSSDNQGNSTTASFLINVVDTVKPLLTLPADIVAEATGPLGASVSFTALASDSVDGIPNIACNPASETSFPLGQTLVTCTAWDSYENTASDSFTVTVNDTVAPDLLLPADITAQTTEQSGIAVNYSASANDNVDTSVSVSCSPLSGSLFTLGQTTVSCSASDSQGNQASGSFIVSVAAPLNTPASVATELTWTTPTTRENGETLSASDLAGYEIQINAQLATNSNTVVINDPLISRYEIGSLADDSYSISIRAFDTSGLYSAKSIAVTLVVSQGEITVTTEDPVVQDTSPPTLLLPDNISVEATASTGATVAYTASATDNAGQAAAVICSPTPGNTFSIGQTTVNCDGIDTTGNTTSGSFTVTVVDTTNPSLTLPADINIDSTDPAGTVVSYTTEASDTVDSNVAINCIPSSGSIFAIGSHTVACDASDDQGNSVTGGFLITVNDVSTSSDGAPTGSYSGTITLNWVIPTTRENGTPLSSSELAGFEINILSDSAASDSLIEINNPLTTRYELSGLADDSYTVSIKAFDTSGLYSIASTDLTLVISNGELTVTSDNDSLPELDTSPPILTLPGAMNIEAIAATGAVVTYTASVTDNVDQTVQLNCSPTSGNTFVLGQTTVNCNATDTAGNTVSGSFIVTVVDTTNPSLNLPADISVDTTDSIGTVVSYAVEASDTVDSSVSIVCIPESGSVFAIGNHAVACNASDDQGNSVAGGFLVTVNDVSTGSEDSPAISYSGTITLIWVLPTTRENGSSLPSNELAGFEIYIVSDSASGDSVIEIDDPVSISHTINNLPPDTYYFSISAVDIEGLQSGFSDIVTVVVQ